VDHSLSELFHTLRDCGFDRNTLVIITADHGEEFLEHRYVEHGWTLYEEVLRVPLIFWAPEILAPGISRNAVSSIDILPTLTTLWGLNLKLSRFDGRPLFSGEGKKLSILPASRRSFFGETLIQHRNILRTVVAGSWKYLTAWRYLPPENRPRALENRSRIENDPQRFTDCWGRVIHRELYNLALDPGEQENRIKTDSGVAGRLHRQMMRYLRYGRRRRFHRQPDLESRRTLSPEDREKLKSLGYL
jgi:arylsulfatase A-like enzyme